jgi:UDP:flavonoid glycosyltransferase YjiC (YdhE family)
VDRAARRSAALARRRRPAHLRLSQAFPALPQLLEHLRGLACPTLLFVPGADAKLVQQFSSPTLKFESQRLDLTAVASECDLAIVHGTHGTAFAMLMAGKPTLQLPLYLEHGLLGTTICNIGSALQPPIHDVRLIRRDLQRMLGDGSFAHAAREFAVRHADFDQVAENELMVARVEKLAAQASKI